MVTRASRDEYYSDWLASIFTASLPAVQPENARLSGHALNLIQLAACLKKRLLFSSRNWTGSVVYVLLPLFLVCVGLVVALIGNRTFYSEPPILLSTRQYVRAPGNEGTNYITLSDQNMYRYSYDAGTRRLMDTLRLPSGVGAVCVLKSPMLPSNSTDYTHECFGDDAHRKSEYFTKRRQASIPTGVKKDLPLYRPCYCERTTLQTFCDSGDVREPDRDVMPTGDVIHNISRTNETLFLYSTMNTDKYLATRYGGLSFGNSRPYVPKWMTLLPLSFNRIVVRNVVKVGHRHVIYMT